MGRTDNGVDSLISAPLHPLLRNFVDNPTESGAWRWRGDTCSGEVEIYRPGPAQVEEGPRRLELVRRMFASIYCFRQTNARLLHGRYAAGTADYLMSLSFAHEICIRRSCFFRHRCCPLSGFALHSGITIEFWYFRSPLIHSNQANKFSNQIVLLTEAAKRQEFKNSQKGRNCQP